MLIQWNKIKLQQPATSNNPIWTSPEQLEEAGTTDSFCTVWTAFRYKHRKGATVVATQEVGKKTGGET